MADPDLPDGQRAVFGRRKGKKLRTHHTALMQDLLPRVRLDTATLREDPARLFGRSVDDCRLEIGFGGGEHLADDAMRHPGSGFIGCEPFVNGVAKLLALVAEYDLENVRVYPGDATAVLAAMPEGCLARISILYPDPWPKPRQRKRRFVSPQTVAQFARVLRPGGEVRLATDIDDYCGWALRYFLADGNFAWAARSSADWLSPWPHWPGTRYEAKALREGRRPVYLAFLRR